MAKSVRFSNLLKVITPKSKKTITEQDTSNNQPDLATATKEDNVLDPLSFVLAIEGDMIELASLDDDVHFGSPLTRVPTPHPVKKNQGHMVMEDD
ncbi:hypothetical protein BO78DRAFT_400238 [Aspergillus sclerotiicarbonarius CBS 121057]|uniref:Uncharacterized protein n=1 Tax=Aspergillus sclerotiicarbonarius (strain CBS 121057 / IBT 28362) TaxID=1448318 RepID=A0A319DYG5_ASPSB|nr:hypothetical protein BO78DRAFT_400238 [Aspergillus sclerotiicarbonarius CBS 121057]